MTVHQAIIGRAQESPTAHALDRPTLRLVTCGSVDDGKSTLVGRLLFDSKMLLDDQLDALTSDSKVAGTTGPALDFALLVDGLQAEREQGITIDVAYRFFATARRRFVIADTPGHVQYTRNMATGASQADLAVVLIDARKGVVSQTRRHCHILALLGVRHVLVAVNKMDLVDFDADRFKAISTMVRTMAGQLGLTHVQCVPVAACDGDNIIHSSARMPWYDGPSVMQHLEQVDVSDGIAERPFRFPVQWANRPNAEFRGLSGRVASGTLRCGDPVVVLPSGRRSRVSGIVTADSRLQQAVSGQSVTLLLADEIDASRGDVLASGAPPDVTDHIVAHLIWFDDEAMRTGRRYLLKSGTSSIGAVVSAMKHRVCIDTMAHEAAPALEANEIGCVEIALDRPLVCDAYRDNRDLGSFILIDPFSRHTVAAGLIDAPLRRPANISWHPTTVDKAARARLKQQKPCVLWLTGLSGAGKSTIANLVDRRLCELGRHTALLDGDNLRHGINRDLGFTPEARVENIRRVAEIAALFVDAGLITLVSLISPFRADRDSARRRFGDGEFIEIHVATPLSTCEARDPKGLYKRARAGELSGFTGIDQPYEAPDRPEITIDAGAVSAETAAELIVRHLREQHYI
ncbi:putative bifunctional enzyme: Sulfate adenylyltransferase (SAT) subunit 1 (N-terminal); Adenylyl-sulfate kinase (APS kinase)(C-terminal)(NodQ/CysNC-like) [Bradyrhizobium sp. ORS 375]|uniref:adenylyl-sulfate kinase n=1 Tax=Bradyrhizobium sp. (strain ORS 375) TaxID=566679 RepID=UPI0002406A3E|nr:adenylyl-sulfate kinase [Bradyrhizobium sp. ORS 375]CCD95630.1 putative bifunctional enzyme: Sulfate adenylyltransferase (SAT) subunit 1 (N-terminal); Adenylyl-sulfate kinase (APS kinase)(C-terminal)(NodQ/CysNC-like) [Bradyrhizobium sp. ORS 375]